MMFKDRRFRYPETGPSSRSGEDNFINNALYREVPIAAVSGQGSLYVYRYHGRNAYWREHYHRMFFTLGCHYVLSRSDNSVYHTQTLYRRHGGGSL